MNGHRNRNDRIDGARARGVALRCMVAVLALLAPAPVLAVSVNPTILFLDSRTRTGTLTLTNNGLRAEEIDLSFSFGMAVSDENGTVRIVFPDSVGSMEPSAVSFLRAFPRRFRLEPGQTQVVRVLAQPPEGLPAGEYWARVMVGSEGGQPPVEQRTGDVTMQVKVRTVVAVGLYYRQGQTETSLEVESARATTDADAAHLFMQLHRGGNAAYLGRVKAAVVDASGTEVARYETELTVQHDLLWRVDVPLPDGVAVGPGYRIRYEIETVRPGIPNGLIGGNTVRGSAEIGG